MGNQPNPQPQNPSKTMDDNGHHAERITLNVLEDYERKSCACWKCKAACQHMPGYLIPSDLERFRERFGIGMLAVLRASNGARVRNTITGREFRIPTIIPERNPLTGHCVFYGGGECAIHDIAPFGCAAFEVCGPLSFEVEARSRAGLMAINGHTGYDKVWRMLAVVKGTTEPAEGRAALQRALEEGEPKNGQE